MTAIHATGAPRLLSPLRASARWISILIIFLPGFATVEAQSPPSAVQASPRSAVNLGADEAPGEVDLLVGRSSVLNTATPISRVSLTSPDIADVLVTNSQQVLIHGKTPGTISMFVWDRAGAIRRYEVVVRRDLSQLDTQLRQYFPGESITVASNGTRVVLSGTVVNKLTIDKAAEVAAGYVGGKKEDVVNLLQQPEGLGTTQVLLRVRFAEVSRTALTELGASFFTDATGYKDWIGRTTTQQFAAPIFDDGQLIFSDFLNFFLFNTKHSAGTLIKALQTRGLFQSLAEPNLIAQNGKEASFLAGGEYPYPVVQGSNAGLAVTIMFKEFGIKLNFTPTVLGGDLIHLKVRPEVSSLDFTNAISLQGFRVPALSTRRTETEIELRDGQTFAVAGLLNNTMTSTLQKIPGIGDIPILGLLFQSKAARKERTELVVMITPQIIKPGSPGAATSLPGLQVPYLPPIPKPLPTPAPYGPPRSSLTPTAPGAAPANPAASVTPAVPGLAASPSPAPAADPATAVQPPAGTTTVGPPAPAAAAAPATRTLTKQEREAEERARKEEQRSRAAALKALEAVEKRAAEAAKVDARRAAEQAKRDAVERKRQEEVDRRRGQAIAEAEARLREAQAAYQAEVNRSKNSQSKP